MKNLLIIYNVIFLLAGNVLLSNIHYIHDHSHSHNHEYYYELTNLANALNADYTYKQKIREASFKAMQNN